MADEHATPYALDEEKAVLGAVLVRGCAVLTAAGGLGASDFYRAAHQRIFSSMLRLAERGETVDFLTVKRDLAETGGLDSVGGPAYLAALVDGMPHGTDVAAHARIVKRTARARAIVELATGAVATFSQQPSAVANGLGTQFLDAFTREIAAAHDGDEAVDTCSESIATFVTETAPPRPPLVEGFIPGQGQCLWHGHPRTRKSLVALETCIALATGTPPFSLERLAVAEPTPVWYCTEEDPVSEVRLRVLQLLAGRNLMEAPESFRLTVRRGISLDDPVWRDRLIRETKRYGARVVFLDPLRSMTANSDQGPRELKPLVTFLRAFMSETGAVLVLLHHDTKPPSGAAKPDDRPRAQRASGGGIFSVSDAPIHFERVDDSLSLLVPSSWKFGTDPTPIRVRLESTAATLRLVGEDVTATAGGELALHERILEYLKERPGSSGSSVAQGIKTRKEAVLGALERLAIGDHVDTVDGPRGGRRWFIRGQAV